MQRRVGSAVAVCEAGPDGVCHRCVDLWSCHSQASTAAPSGLYIIIGSRNESAVAQSAKQRWLGRSVSQAA